MYDEVFPLTDGLPHSEKVLLYSNGVPAIAINFFQKSHNLVTLRRTADPFSTIRLRSFPPPSPGLQITLHQMPTIPF